MTSLRRLGHLLGTARGHAGVKALVYLGAFAPDQGESALQLAGRFPGRQMAATQRPGSVTGLSDGSGEPAWKTIPSWYLIPAQDDVIPPAAQRFMAERAGSRVREINSSHVVMMSHPAAATAVVLSAYAATR